jgi:hypothetical protein
MLTRSIKQKTRKVSSASAFTCTDACLISARGTSPNVEQRIMSRINKDFRRVY